MVTEAVGGKDVLTLLGFFAAGLAVNLTPCVYPMFLVTLSLFKPKPGSQETLWHSFFRALAYFIGIVIMYSALGYFAASTGKVFGAALQNSFVQGAVGFMMLALALSMFGFYQIQAPSALIQKLASLRNASFLGFFFSGLFVGVFAAPCIGPPVIALLGAVAERGSPQFGLLAFFIFAAGLGLPYLILGTFSIYVPKLPKAGQWLIWVERFFGVILLGFAAFYLASAFHIALPKASLSKEVAWQVYSMEELQKAHESQKIVMVDFYADWCLNCHELARDVFSKPEFQAATKDFVPLRIDATNIDDPKIQTIVEQYEIIGLPTVLFIGKDGKEISQARVEGAASLAKFLKIIEAIGKKE